MDADYVKENPYIYLSVKGDDMVFQITACFITDIDFDYIAPNPTGEELTNFFEQVAKKNWLEFDGVTFTVTVYVDKGTLADQFWDKLTDFATQVPWWQYAEKQQSTSKYPKYW